MQGPQTNLSDAIDYDRAAILVWVLLAQAVTEANRVAGVGQSEKGAVTLLPPLEPTYSTRLCAEHESLNKLAQNPTASPRLLYGLHDAVNSSISCGVKKAPLQIRWHQNKRRIQR